MDELVYKRNKKSDKTRKNFEFNGGITKKYIRINEIKKNNSKNKK
jgi:hypothetical protein